MSYIGRAVLLKCNHCGDKYELNAFIDNETINQNCSTCRASKKAKLQAYYQMKNKAKYEAGRYRVHCDICDSSYYHASQFKHNQTFKHVRGLNAIQKQNNTGATI